MVSSVMAVLAAIVAVIWFVAKGRVRDLQLHREYQNDFFDAANVLMESDEVPRSVADFVLAIGRTLGSPRAPRILVMMFVRGEVRAPRKAADERLDPMLRDAKRMRPELYLQFSKALVTCTLALTYRSLMLGLLLRRVSFYRVRKEGPKCYDGGEDAVPPMLALTTRMTA